MGQRSHVATPFHDMRHGQPLRPSKNLNRELEPYDLKGKE